MKSISDQLQSFCAPGRKIIFILLLLFFTWDLQAQEDNSFQKSSSFQLDAGTIQIKEKNLMPKVHHGLYYGLEYGHSKQKKNFTAFHIGLGLSRLKTAYEVLSPSANVQIHGDFLYLFEMIKKTHFTYHLGPGAGLNYDASYFPNWDESHLYWVSNLALGIRNKFNYQVNDRQFLVVDLGCSLFSLFSRPELDRQYKIDDISIGGILENLHSNSQGGTINKSLFLSFQAEYQFHTGENITQAICYAYDFSRVKSKEGFAFLENVHKIGLKIYF